MVVEERRNGAGGEAKGSRVGVWSSSHPGRRVLARTLMVKCYPMDRGRHLEAPDGTDHPAAAAAGDEEGHRD